MVFSDRFCYCGIEYKFGDDGEVGVDASVKVLLASMCLQLLGTGEDSTVALMADVQSHLLANLHVREVEVGGMMLMDVL